MDYKTLPVGTEVEVTIKGKIEATSSFSSKPPWAVRVNDGDHFHHLCFNDVGSNPNFTVKVVEPYYEYGKAYEDAAGDVFLRTDDGWLDIDGDRFSHDSSYVKHPLTLLVKQPKLQAPTQTIAAILRLFNVPSYLLGYQEV